LLRRNIKLTIPLVNPRQEFTMSLITAFEIITLTGMGLSLFAIAAFEVSDAKVDRLRNAKRQFAVAHPARRSIIVRSEVSAAANQAVELSKAA